MKLLSIGKFVQKLNYKENLQNYETWLAMSKYFDDIFLIVQSTDRANHEEHIDKLHIYWIGDRGISIGKQIYFMIESYRIGARLIEAYGIDILNIGDIPVSGIPAVMLKKKYKKPLVAQAQGQLTKIPKGTFSKLKTFYIYHSTLFVCKKADKVRTVSDEIRKTLISQGIHSKKVVCVPSRCDTKKFDPNIFSSKRKERRRKMGYSDEHIVIEFTGRVVAYRDIESDIKALALAAKQNDKLRLLVVGDGPDLVNNKKLAKELGVSEKVLFVGRVSFEDIPKMLSIADIFISTPTNEAIARSVLEAMAMELPVIATNVGGTSEAVTYGVNGILVNVGAVDEIAKAMLDISESEKTRAEMGVSAREKILEKYEFNEQIKKFANVHFNI